MQLDTIFTYVQLFYSNQGEECIFSLGYADPTVVTMADSAAEMLIQQISDKWTSGGLTDPGAVAMVPVLFATQTIYKSRVYLRYDATKPAIKLDAPLNYPGTRDGAGTGYMPALITASGYAPSTTIGQRGSHVGISNVGKADVNGQTFTAFTGGSGYATAVQFMIDCYADNTWDVVGDGSYPLRPVVIPRVGYVTPGGKDATRLPLEGGDPISTYTISPWSIAPNTGTQGKRKKKLRGV